MQRDDHPFCCLFPQCNATFPDPEALNQHVAAHFTHGSSQGSTRNFNPTPFHSLHPTNSNDAPTLSSYITHNGTISTYPNMTPAPKGPIPNIAASTNSPVAPAQEPNTENRVPCPRCHNLFTRQADMERHAKSHDNSRKIQCPVLGCTYRGYYRKDKVNQHIGKRHPGVARI